MALQEKLQKELDAECADSNRIPGAILYLADRNGDTLAHIASGLRSADKKEPMALDQLHWIASCTKLITAIACLQLVEQGKVKLDEPVVTIVPKLGQLMVDDGSHQLREPKTKVTLHHLLTHTAGQSYEFFNPQTCHHFTKSGLKSFSASRDTITAPLVADPGTKWEYGTSIDWASQVVEHVSGLDLDSYFKKHIFEPLGIKSMTTKPETGVSGGVKARLAGLHQRGKDGNITAIPHLIQLDESKLEVQYGGAGLFANAAEYCQILVALVNGGTHPKTKGQILKPESVEELFKDRLSEKLVADLDRPFEAALPEITNPFISLEGIAKQWTYGGQSTPQGVANGRSNKSVWWAGIANHYWFLDREDGTVGMIQAQVMPFFDPYIVPFFFFKAEAAAHEYAKSVKV